MAERIVVSELVNRVVGDAMLDNNYVMAVQAATTQKWGEANVARNEAWTEDNTDPATGEESEISKRLELLSGISDKEQGRQEIDKIITDSELMGNVNAWSIEDGIELEGYVAKFFDKESNSSLQSTAVSQIIALIQASQSREAAISSAQQQAGASKTGNFAQAMNVLSGMGDKVIEIMSSISNFIIAA